VNRGPTLHDAQGKEEAGIEGAKGRRGGTKRGETENEETAQQWGKSK